MNQLCCRLCVTAAAGCIRSTTAAGGDDRPLGRQRSGAAGGRFPGGGGRPPLPGLRDGAEPGAASPASGGKWREKARPGYGGGGGFVPGTPPPPPAQLRGVHRGGSRVPGGGYGSPEIKCIA
jgi:hypothetical protein